MKKKLPLYFAVAIPFSCLALFLIYQLPPVHDRLAWRLEEQMIVLRMAISPPERIEFAVQNTAVAVFPSPTLPATPTPSLTPDSALNPAVATSVSLPASTPQPTPTPTPTNMPLPASLNLSGVRYQDQHGLWNYCAPTNLAMAISFWGEDHDRREVGDVVKPNLKDKNVMPYEMESYVLEHTDLAVVVRVGGDAQLLKTFLAGGFPVLVEKGAYMRDLTNKVTWMGHYQVVTGYDDAKGVFITQDSYYTPDYEVPYDEFISNWRSFNYTYLIIYSPDNEDKVFTILGSQADEIANYQYAAGKAAEEVYQFSGVDQFFAWYNRGTNLMYLQDYAGAAAAYDEAFVIYNNLPEDRQVRPYRILWYQTGPYFAYYYTGRYYDVISLANSAIEAVSDDAPALEESFYWRGMAKAALGDTTGAIEDYRESLTWHPDFGPPLYQLSLLGVEP